MRTVLPLLAFVLVTATTTAADPKPEESSAKYLAVLQKTAEVLAKVNDEATAMEAKPKLDTLHEEARDARKKMFRALAELDIPESTLTHFFEQLPKILRQTDSAITAEFDRIGNNKKGAYKVLRETKLFAALEKEYEERATMAANLLLTYARIWEAKNDGKVLKLEVLAQFSDTGKKGLVDPWGYPYQLAFQPGKDGKRLRIWTVNPYTGKKLGFPPPDDKDK